MRWLPLLCGFDESDLGPLMGTSRWTHHEHMQVYAERSPEAKILQYKTEGTRGAGVKVLKLIENIWRHGKAQLTFYSLSATGSCSSSKCLTDEERGTTLNGFPPTPEWTKPFPTVFSLALVRSGVQDLWTPVFVSPLLNLPSVLPVIFSMGMRQWRSLFPREDTKTIVSIL